MMFSFSIHGPAPAPVEKAKDSECRRPSLRELGEQAERALRDRRGLDVTGLSHEERNKILFGK